MGLYRHNNLYIYICVYIYICICIYIYMYIYIYVYVYMYMSIYIYIYLYCLFAEFFFYLMRYLEVLPTNGNWSGIVGFVYLGKTKCKR